tara:strand:- start:2923 stop:3258 length:336 start_codon:yes stop_codon:yes gene_type:complete
VATYDDLAPDQQAAIDELMRLVRPLGRTFAQAAHRAGVIQQSHQQTTKAILDSLDAGSEIPNKTDLAGATAMTVEDVAGLLADLAVVESSFGPADNTARYLKAAGLNAVIE